jgi:alkylation response protein AidB-like acyl-CoA dehydrogenase
VRRAPTEELVIRRGAQRLGPAGTGKDQLLEKCCRGIEIPDTFEGSGHVQRIIGGRAALGAASR